RRLDGRERWHVPDHRQRAVFRVQREGHLPLHGHLPDGRVLCAFDPSLGNALATGLGDDIRIVRVEKDPQLRGVERLLIRHARRRLNLIRVIEQDPEITDPPHTGLGTYRRLAGFDARIAEDALLGFAGLPVVINFLVGTAADAHAPAAALLLVDEHDAVFLAFVDGTRGA